MFDGCRQQTKCAPGTAAKQRGYSLVELLVVTAILLSVTALAVPALNPATGKRTELAAVSFATAIRFARSEARRTATPHGFTLTAGQPRLRVFRLVAGTPTYDVYDPVSKQLYDIDTADERIANLDGVSSAPVFRGVCNDTDKIIFDAMGTPWCQDPQTVLLQTTSLTLSSGTQQRVITLDGISGRVGVQ